MPSAPSYPILFKSDSNRKPLLKFNDNNESLYCNAFERYFAPSSPILFPE